MPATSRQQLGQVLLGRYLVDRLVGEGTFAWVFHGRTRKGLEVAIKVLRPGGDPRAALRFAREARVHEALPASPHVVEYLGKGLTMGGDPFIVMEYVDGITLREGLLATPTLPQRRAVAFVAELCQAFAGLHQLGVVHRDVKPANVLLPRSGGIKLTDFGAIRDAQGILRLLEDEEEGLFGAPVFADEVDRGVLVGTLAYMSPEQFEDFLDASRVRADTPSDVFGLGVILYELLSGRRPISRPLPDVGTFNEALLSYARWRVHLADADLAPLDGVAPTLESIVWKALARDPMQRQPDCRALMVELVGYLRSGTGAQPIEQGQTVEVALEAAARYLTSTEIEVPRLPGIDPERPTGITPGSAEPTLEDSPAREPAALFLRQTRPAAEEPVAGGPALQAAAEDLEDTTSRMEGRPAPRGAPLEDGETTRWKGSRPGKGR